MEKHITTASLSLLLLCLLSFPKPSCQQNYTRPNVNPHVTVSENAVIGDVINTIRDDAPNSPGKIATVVYRGSNQDFYASKIPHQSVWKVILNRTLDYETQTKFEVVFEAQGAKGQHVESTEARFILHVRDENDNAPQFLHLPYNAEVDEDAILGTSININILATDVDTGSGGKVRYELVPVSQGTDSEGKITFLMDSENGHVTLNGSLDYETKTFYHYRVVAKDCGTPALSSSTDLFITVQDVQDSPPLFVNIPYVASLPENTQLMTSVLTVRAVDQDRAIPNSVTYNVTHSTCPDLFGVDAHSGVISVSGPLDTDAAPLKDRNGLCTIQLQATEENSNAHPQRGNFTATATATINVLDLDDNPPYFSNTSFSASIRENSPAGTPVQLDNGQQIMVSDIDQGLNADFHLSLSTDCLRISPSSARGQATVVISVQRPSCFDYETRRYMDFQVLASGGADGSLRTRTTVRLNIGNTNDNPPYFRQSQYSVLVQENMMSSTVIATVEAVDMDSPPYDGLQYFLYDGDGMFSINTTTGEVEVSQAQLDYETRQQYQLRVEARDIGGLRDSVSLTVTLTDLNDNTPQFVRPQYQAFVLEGDTQFQRTLQVQAKDADGTEQNRGVQYSLSNSSQWSSHFTVNASTGLLQLTSPLDSETLGEEEGVITLVVLATDQGHPPRTGSVNVTVTVQSKNDVDVSSQLQNRRCHTGNQTAALTYQRVSFHAHGLRNTHPDQGSALIVDNVVINQGHGYNGDTGIFIAPLNGNYFFTGSTELWTSSHSGQLTLNADDQVIALVNSKSHGPVEAVSVHGIVHLRAGQQVWLRVSSGVEISSATTSFSGYMISVDP